MIPLYRDVQNQKNPDSAGWNNAYGFAYTPLLIDEVLADFDFLDGEYSLTLYDIDDAAKTNRFYASALTELPVVDELIESKVLSLYGRQWKAELKATPLFVSNLNLFNPRQIAGDMITLSALLAMTRSSAIH